MGRRYPFDIKGIMFDSKISRELYQSPIRSHLWIVFGYNTLIEYVGSQCIVERI